LGKAIGEILPYALGVAISPIPIIAIILMLVTPKATSNGSAFAIGWVLGLAVIATIVLILAAGNNYSTSGGPARTSASSSSCSVCC
jgi:Sap, sulfolipid-1-addressing protein